MQKEQDTQASMTDTPEKNIKFWMHEVNTAKRRLKEWHDLGEKIIKIYSNQLSNGKEVVFNILWANVQTLEPAIYSNTPQPDVRRRFRDKDVVGRHASEVLERCLSYFIDSYNFDNVAKSPLLDSLLAGLGQARVRYEAITKMVEPQIPVDMEETIDENGVSNFAYPEGAQFNEDGVPYVLGEPQEEKVYEKVICEYVHWKDFLWGDAKQWKDVPWVAFRSYYTKEMMIEEVGKEIADKVKYTEFNVDEDFLKNNEKTAPSSVKRAEVWEIWDKTTKTQIFISVGYPDDILKQQPVPIEFEGVFPCPEPLVPIKINGDLTPIPEYSLYGALADELNEVSARIIKLTGMVKAAYFYDKAIMEIERLLQELRDGEGLPVTMNVVDGNQSLKDHILWLPIKETADVIFILSQQRDSIIRNIYEITGISDIVRGQGDANETATAQRIKGRYAALRIESRQKEMQRFIRDLLRLKAEVISEIFSPETLEMITGLPVDEQVMALLRANEPRMYRIDIETDSTIAADIEAEQAQAVQLVEAMAQFSQVAPTMASVLGQEFVKEMLLMVFRKFKVGRTIEQSLDDASTQPPQPQGPSPEEIKAAQEDKKIQADMLMQQNDQKFEAVQNQQDRMLDLMKTIISKQPTKEESAQYANR